MNGDINGRARIAAVIIAILTAALTAGCAPTDGSSSSASSPAAGTGTSPTASTAAGEGPIPSFAPRDYVALEPANLARLNVRDTVTGAVAATVPAPRGMVFTGVFGTGTGRVFIVDARPDPPTTMSGDNLFLLRLASAAEPGRVAPLPLVSLHQVGQTFQPTRVTAALSPDASKIAITYTSRPVPPKAYSLTIYSTATGTALRDWTISSGIITAADLTASGDLQQDAGGTSLRWSADGRWLAYAFHAASAGKQGNGYERYASVRVVGTTAPGHDLLAGSRTLAGAVPVYNPGNGGGNQCLTSNGWSLSADGQAVTCAASWMTPSAQSPVTTPIPANCPATGKHVYIGFWRSVIRPGGGGEFDTIYGPCPAGHPADVQLFWASPDGKMVLGTLDYPGHSMFGLFSAGREVIPLAPPPASVKLYSVAW